MRECRSTSVVNAATLPSSTARTSDASVIVAPWYPGSGVAVTTLLRFMRSLHDDQTDATIELVVHARKPRSRGPAVTVDAPVDAMGSGAERQRDLPDVGRCLRQRDCLPLIEVPGQLHRSRAGRAQHDAIQPRVDGLNAERRRR